MILVADSGSTKTDWRLINEDGKIEQAKSQGLNPMILDEAKIVAILQEELPTAWQSKEIKQIDFYGAGCVDALSKNVIADALRKPFPSAEIQVSTDLLAAAKSVCGNQPGIVCILGTGSNCCLYDGTDIIKHVPPLGYILGDEGSASALGKSFLKAFLRDELPENLSTKVAGLMSSKEEILNQVYHQVKPNEYLASYAQIIGDHQKEPFMANLVMESFERFLDLVDSLNPPPGMAINFVGSVACYFSNILQRALKQRGYTLGRIVQSPIAGLALLYSETSK